MSSTIVLGDLHLRSDGDRSASTALVELLGRHRDAPVVLAGDSIDLAAEPTSSPVLSLRAALAPYAPLRAALAERASRGVFTTFLTGNHDAAVATPQVIEALHDALGLAREHRPLVRAEPWFVRLAGGRVHVEHGHLLDPDAAPAHPLAPTVRDDLGIAILRKFIVPVGAHGLVAANGEAPLPLLMRVVRTFGSRAPIVVARYLAAAATTVAESGARFQVANDRAAGGARLSAFAAEAGADRELLEHLIDAHATPTRARRTSTFFRLYLDRVLATSALLFGVSLQAGALLLGPRGALGDSVAASVGSGETLSRVGVSLATLGALTLGASLIAGRNRYAGRCARKLAEGAETIASLTGATTVILGHAHVPSEGPHYKNTSSFEFSPRGDGRRPYLRVEDDGVVSRAWA